MKEIFLKRSIFFLLISGLIFGMTGCEADTMMVGEMFDNQPEYLLEKPAKQEKILNSKVNITKLSYEVWQDQLDYLINKGTGVQFITEQGLTLINYKLIDKNISKDLFLMPPSYVVSYNDRRDQNRFEIIPLSKIKEVEANIDKEYSDFKNELLDSLSTVALSSVQLTWKYRSNEFITICLVSDSEVVYDDILSRIRIMIQVESENVVNNSFSRLKNGSESGQDGAINYGYVTPRQEVYSYSGELMAYAYCQFNVRGSKQNGVKIIENCHYEAFPWAKNGLYHAAAQIKLVSFGSGSNGHAHFEYACIADSKPVGITWNGFNFIIAGGENKGFSGGQWVSTSMLY